MDTGITRRRQFIKNRSQPLTIGFTAIADFSSSIGQEYIAGITAAANDYGVNFINMADAVRHTLFVGIHFLPQYLTKLQFMKAPLIDGLVTWASTLCEYMKKEQVQELFSQLSPLPMVDIGYLDIPGVPSIRIDNPHSMHLLVDHMVNVHGFSRFAFMGATSSRPHSTRMECFVSELKAHNLSFHGDDIFMTASLEAEDIIEQADKLINRYLKDGHLELDAIITSSDIIASTLIAEFEKRGFSVPDDIAITGFNNQYPGITTNTPVTTIDLVYHKRGYEAVELLIDRIMGLEVPDEPHFVKTSLIVRQSCGCFESSVIDAMNCTACLPENISALPEAQASESDVRSYLTNAFRAAYVAEEDRLQSLVDAAVYDIYETSSEKTEKNTAMRPARILTWFRELFKNRRSAETEQYEEKISALRRIIMPLVSENPQQRERIENICHALRTLHSMYAQYDFTGRRGEAYVLANMTNIAINFTSSTTIDQLEQVLRFKLSELGISGIIIALCPNMSPDLSSTEIQTIIPEPPSHIAETLPCKVREPAVFPRRFFPQNKRFEMILSLLCCNGLYMGYAFITMNSRNMGLYDNIRELLSQTLYAIYLREEKIKDSALIISDQSRLMQRIPLQVRSHKNEHHGKLTAESIMNYLVSHLDEMTDLEAIADHFCMSKSNITRKTKELTGYSVQVLHERLKIEQAKDLIKAGSMKMLDIAQRLGFSNPNYFSNVFKKVTGESPRAWANHNARIS